MLIDKPRCNFKNCRFYFDGNCRSADIYENCKLTDLYSEIAKLTVDLDNAKSEVERLNAELVRVQARHPFAMTLFELEACEKHAAIEAVKEVWRELRCMCDAPHWCVWLSEIDDYFEKKTGVEAEDIAELKKKYTENENG